MNLKDGVLSSNWKCNFFMTPHVRRRLDGRSVFYVPNRALVFNSFLYVILLSLIIRPTV